MRIQKCTYYYSTVYCTNPRVSCKCTCTTAPKILLKKVWTDRKSFKKPNILEMISFFSSELEQDQEDLAYKLFSVFNDNQLSGYIGTDDMS